MHPPFFLIKCLLFALPFLRSLRTSLPSQITSALFFAIPSPRQASRHNAMPLRCFAPTRFAIAVQCCSVDLPRYALPLHSSSPHSLRKASPCIALPCRCHSAPCVAFAHLLKSRQCRCNANHCYATHSHRTANRTQPCHCKAFHRTAKPCSSSANHGRQCHALALRPSPHRRCK